MPHDHGHSHAHHHHHGHGHAHDGEHNVPHNAGSERRIGLTALLTGGFMAVEVVGGILAGSLALIADAGHMLSDFASLALAWVAFRIARRPADSRRTYGFSRFSVLAAFVNGLALFAIAAWICIEAAIRVFHPGEVLAGTMLWVAVGGLVVNIVAFLILHGADRNSLNVRGALLHVIGDLLGSVAAIAAALIIMATGWTIADPILSALIAAIILRSAWSLVAESAHILLEGAPRHLEVAAIIRDLEQEIEGVHDIHHAHLWSLDGSSSIITLHARVDDPAAAPDLILKIKERLRDQHGVGHATVEIETDFCASERECA